MVGVETREDFVAENYYFLAPEVLNGEVPSPASDVWALGAALFYLVSARTVYMGTNYNDYINNVAVHDPNFTDSAWSSVSASMKKLVKSMLARSKDERVTMDQVFFDDWTQCKIAANEITIIEDIRTFERDREYNLCVFKAINAIANTKTKKGINSWQAALNQMAISTMEFGALIARVLGDSHPLYEEFTNYWQETINFREFFLSVIGLNQLLFQERGAILFYQLSKNGQFLTETEIATFLCNSGRSAFVEEDNQFRQLIRRLQKPTRSDYSLAYTEFLALCDTMDINPSEEFAIGRFFDSIK